MDVKGHFPNLLLLLVVVSTKYLILMTQFRFKRCLQSLSPSVPPHLFFKALSLIVIFPLTVPLLTGDRGPHHSLVILEDAKLTLQVLEHLDNDIYDGANIWCKYQISNIKYINPPCKSDHSHRPGLKVALCLHQKYPSTRFAEDAEYQRWQTRQNLETSRTVRNQEIQQRRSRMMSVGGE